MDGTLKSGLVLVVVPPEGKVPRVVAITLAPKETIATKKMARTRVVAG